MSRLNTLLPYVEFQIGQCSIPITKEVRTKLTSVNKFLDDFCPQGDCDICLFYRLIEAEPKLTS